MALIKPSSGKLIVDKKDINSNDNLILKWRNEISNVPQELYLIDDDFSKNIAFGMSEKNIDFEKIIKASKKANIHQFISNTENKYKTLVGEKGSNLSGGQIQRIAIARALYKESSVIFFDEATSALDEETETKIMREIDNLSNKITLIIISHKLSTIKKCDKVYEIKNGTLLPVLNYNV